MVRQSHLIRNLERAIPNLEEAVNKLDTKLELRTEKVLATYKEKKYFQTLAIPFKKWVKVVLRTKMESHKSRMLENLLVRQRQARTFQQWYRQVHLQKLIDAKTSYDLKLAGVSREIVRKYEDKMMQLEKALALKEEEVMAETRKRHKMEEDVRRAFLKGLSAMNLEAISLFDRTGAHIDMGLGGSPVADSSRISMSGLSFDQPSLSGTLGGEQKPRPPLQVDALNMSMGGSSGRSF